MPDNSNPFRVLCIDGGGMRGYYAARYLAALADCYAETRGVKRLDVGKGFNLIVGTSTGAIIGCALAAAVKLSTVAELYREYGSAIFPVKVPSKRGWDLLWQLAADPKYARQLLRRSKYLKSGAVAMERALHATIGTIKMREVWEQRNIALAIPVVEMSGHHARVLKTPHLPNTRHRDDDYTLAEVCLAATAAPIYRSMARLRNPYGHGHHVFVDGGLWANSPVLVGLVEALELAGEGQAVEVYCLGTCPPPEGDLIEAGDVDRGLFGWLLGGAVINVSLRAQEYANHNMAQFLSVHVRRQCTVIRFPQGTVPANLMQYFDLDETRPKALQAMGEQANNDVSETLRRTDRCRSSADGLIHSLLMGIPELQDIPTHAGTGGSAESEPEEPFQRRHE